MAQIFTRGLRLFVCALALAAPLSTRASAQVTGSIFDPPAQPTAPGRSGHPLMTPQALAAGQANFGACIAGMWPLAQAKGVSRQTFDYYTSDLTPDMKIMDFLDQQPEFSKSTGDYVNMLVTEQRIKRGKEILTRYKTIFDAVEKAYGVDRYPVVAIWGIESDYGSPSGMGNRSVLRSTATLSCIGRRQDFFRDEFIATLQILQKGDVPADHLKGSWAGAFGPTQFMPTSFLRFAVDFDGDGKRNVVDSIPDIIASTANNLKLDGWQFDRPWGYEVELPKNFDYRYVDRSRQMTLAQWSGLGVRRPAGNPFPRASETAFLLLPAGANGPAFLMMRNFGAVLKYNPADAYALAISHLADRLRGGGPFVQKWPDERALSRSERIELQTALAQLGYDIGNVDGILGQKTRVAVQDFQLRSGMLPDGYPGVAVLQRLRQ